MAGTRPSVGFFGGKALTWRAGMPAGVLPGIRLWKLFSAMWPVRFTTNSAKIYPPSGYCCPIPVRGSFSSTNWGRLIRRPVWQPRYTTVDEVMRSLAGYAPVERVRAVAELYKVYSRYHKEGFDSFYFWGEVLLNDFDQIDKYRVDARHALLQPARPEGYGRRPQLFQRAAAGCGAPFSGSVRRGGGVFRRETRFPEYLAQSADDIPRVPGAPGGAGARLYGDDAPPGCGAAAERRGVGGRWPSRGRRGFQCALGVRKGTFRPFA